MSDGRGSIILAGNGVLRRGEIGLGCFFIVWGLMFAGYPLYWLFTRSAVDRVLHPNVPTGILVMLLLGLAGIFPGLLLLLWRKQVRLDAAKGHVEVFSGFFGQTRSDQAPLKVFDSVSMRWVVSGRGRIYYKLSLCAPNSSVISLGEYFTYRADAVKAGLRAAGACGVAFEEYDDGGRLVRLAPEQVARLVGPTATAGQTPWWRRPSAIALVVANLVPIAGVLFGDWKILPLMQLFWLENLVIGLFTVGKILLAQAESERIQGAGQARTVLSSLGLSVIFVFQYGWFALGYGFVLGALFGGTDFHALSDPAGVASLVGDIVVRYGLVWALLALVVSHGVSFYTNYLRPRAFEDAVAGKFMWAPYKRVVILHVVIIVGGLGVVATHATVLPLLLLVALKIIVDLGAHLYEHRSPLRMRNYQAMAGAPGAKHTAMSDER